MAESPLKRPRFSFAEDVVLELADGETIHVHSHVLMAASEVFATMLQSEMQEAQTGRILLKDKTRSELEEVLKHLDLRGGALPPPITRENVEVLLQFADEYQITGLRDRCIPLMKELSEYEAFHFLRVSSRFKVPEVIRFCIQKLLEHYVEEAREEVDTSVDPERKGPPACYRLNTLVKNLLVELEDDPTVRTILYDELLSILSDHGGQPEKAASVRGRSKHWARFVSTFLELKKLHENEPSVLFTREWMRTLMPLLRMAMEDFEQKREEEYQELLRNPGLDEGEEGPEDVEDEEDKEKSQGEEEDEEQEEDEDREEEDESSSSASSEE
eukprot:Skav210425  [mRNA]  locus=scaffold1573:407495:408481:+ [translate_table: standard]